MLLLKNGTVYAPTHMGRLDLLIAGDKIALLGPGLIIPKLYLSETIDLKGKWVFPGLIDPHIHIAGAGGEGGPGSRTEGLKLEQIVNAGITTVVGCLGTDGFTRSVESVLMKAKALRAQGLSAWIYTGSYQIPPPTISGSISRDIALIDEVIGVGEVALADHRSSMPDLNAFLSVLQQARIGGMIGGKSGIVNIHIGDYGEPFDIIEQALGIPGINVGQMLPTHCNRSRAVFNQAIRYAARGYIDLTSSSYPYFPDVEIKPSQAWEELLEAGVSPDAITFSSDAGGSLPSFDQEGRCIGLAEGAPESLLSELIDMISLKPGEPAWVEKTLATITRNTASRLKLGTKGTLKEGASADLLVLDQSMSLQLLVANGKILMRDGRISTDPSGSITE